MLKEIFTRIDEIRAEMVDIRRDLHMHPELSFQEKRTPEVIAEYQRRLGLEVKTGVGGNGVVATLYGTEPGRTVAIRADFDALPIHEQNDVPYKSKNPGVMHACGHDAHTAIALGLSKVLSEKKDQLKGNVVFIHQHAEELNPGGAKAMLDDGCLEGVNVIFATHMENYFPVGKIIYSNGYILAASDEFEIEVKGIGGHGAFPQDTSDSVVIGSQLVCNLQQIVSRRIDPLKSAVVSVGSFQSGKAANVIADNAIIKGTVRTFDEDVRQKIERMIEDITSHTCQASGADYEVRYKRGYPATWNHPEPTELLIDAAKEVVDDNDIVSIPPNMGGEDFSYFLQKVPGTYFFTGSANEEKGFIYPYHHPKFDIDEDALVIGAKTLASATLKYLEA
jgi:amidohydrolase